MASSPNSTAFSAAPFATNILWPPDMQPLPPLDSLLPAVFREESLRRLAAPSLASSAYLAAELGLGRLDGFTNHWFWLLGSPALPMPLHDCVHRGRTICITERMDRHLGLGLGGARGSSSSGGGGGGGGNKSNLLYVKPLPRFLLDTRAWTVLSCDCAELERDGGPEKETEGKKPDSMRSATSTRSVCSKRHLRDCALGLLYSYAALVAHESDFRIAQEHGLLPPQVSWDGWRVLAREVVASPDVARSRFHRRFLYGELRLNRLREISLLRRGGLLPVLAGRLDLFARFFQQNVRWLASLVAYTAIVLSALQSGLATEALAASAAFQRFATGFTMFALVAPLAILGGFALYFGLSVAYNVAMHVVTSHLKGVDGDDVVLHHWDSDKSEV